MKIAVMANDQQWEELISSVPTDSAIRVSSVEEGTGEIDAFLIIQDIIPFDMSITSKPVLLNAVCHTLKAMNAPSNVVRFNGWNSFISGNTWELAGQVNNLVEQILTALGKQMIAVPDEPGFISARIISMIINEAYFALEDKVSTKKEIDLAMKLGTNYPYGPFEWASIIGVKDVFGLLETLSMHDNRYLPAHLLKQETTQ